VAERFPAPSDRYILSVDVEEYYNHIPDADALPGIGGVPKRAHETLPRLLDLFEERKVHATFFVLGTVVERIEALLGRIAEAGHEIACHGWSHRRVHLMTAAEFAADIARSRDRIEAATGARPRGYRAPAFSMAGSTLWAFDVLRNEGFDYDSSVAPLSNSFYGGLAAAPMWPHRLANGLVEFPMPVYRLGPLRTLIGGGFYLRFFPLWLNRLLLRRYSRRNLCPPVVYIHPWEFDEAKYNPWDVGLEHPCLKERKRFMRWAMTLNRHRALPRFEQLLRGQRWTCFRELLA